MFDKGYTPNWSEEVSVIDSIQYTIKSNHLQIERLSTKITGSFYEPELLKAVQDVFRIAHVLRKDYKKKLALVKCKGYGDEFNSWIPLGDLKNI